tara:strand:+ start:415 stop:978 length:564 start_codon:yes stop_codon:yes gene_type:complete
MEGYNKIAKSEDINLVQKIKKNSLPYIASLGLIFTGCANNTYLNQDTNQEKAIENRLTKHQNKSFPGCESFDLHQFEFNANVVSRLYIDGIKSNDLEDKVAVFDEGGNCRGISSATHYDLSYHGLNYISHELVIYSNKPGEKLTFKAYDSSNDTIQNIIETYNSFVPDDILAGFLNPFDMHAVSKKD